MKKLIYFSEYFKPLASKIQFLISVLSRFLVILFKRRKEIKLLKLDYSRSHLFDKSYLIISYTFKNALWYNFKNIHKTTKTQSVVLNLKNLKTNNITLIVYGLFQKKMYYINIEPEKTLQTQTFKTSISGINKKKTFAAFIQPERKSLLINLPKMKITEPRITLNHSTYNQKDFI
jgi:hypothetical protein